MFPVQDPILTFIILMLIIFIAPLIAGRLKVPDLILLLGSGALLGPNGLGVIERNSAVTMFGSIGLLYIMFIAGLEIDLNRFVRTRNRSILFGLFTFAIPQTVGTFMGHYLLGFNWTTSILLASMFASHTLLAYPIASRLGISRSEPVVITVGGTIITDTLALMVLAVIADSAKGVELGIMFWFLLGLGMTGLVILIAFGVPRLTRWFFKNVPESGGSQFIFVILMVCGSAYLSHFAKMEPIIGAFLAGAVFNRLIPEQSSLMNRLVFVGNILFIPFFLISVGMLVNPKVLVASPQGWLVIASMSICVIVTKYAAAWVTQKTLGYNASAGKVIFGLSVVQAAATLAAVVVGYELKIFDENVLNGAIIMILVTCPLGAWMVDRYGRNLVEKNISTEQPVADQRLIVSIADPDFSMRLLNLAFLIRNKSRRGNIFPVTIVNDHDNSDGAVAAGEKLLAHCMAESASAEMEITPSVRVDLNPSDGLIRAAKELRATQVLAGWSRKQMLQSHLFGTVSENLLESCPSRLLFCRLVQPLNITKRLLVPFPALAEKRANMNSFLHDAKHLAHQVGASLRVYLVTDSGSDLKHRIRTMRPTGSLTVLEGETWTEVQSMFLNDLSENDMVMMPMERRTGIFWTPAMEKLQETVFSRFPGINLLSAYPSLQWQNEEAPIATLPSVPVKPEIFSAEIPAGTEGEAGLETMVRKAFGENLKKFEDVVPGLVRSMNSYPLELSKDIVLIHAHCESVRTPVIIVGRSEREWSFRNLKGAYRILVVLVSPKSAPTEQHLKTLADLARGFLDPKFSEEVCSAASAEEIEKLLRSLK